MKSTKLLLVRAKKCQLQNCYRREIQTASLISNSDGEGWANGLQITSQPVSLMLGYFINAGAGFVQLLSSNDHKSNMITHSLEITRNAHQPKICRQRTLGVFKRCLSVGNRRFQSALLFAAKMYWHDRQADGICFWSKKISDSNDISFPFLLVWKSIFWRNMDRKTFYNRQTHRAIWAEMKGWNVSSPLFLWRHSDGWPPSALLQCRKNSLTKPADS